MLTKKISLRTAILVPLFAVLAMVAIVACADPAASSNNNQQAAFAKWGEPGLGITNFYEYEQEQDIYHLRDDPHLILNAYLYSDFTGQLTCLGKVKGFGVPYGTQESPPSQGSSPVPEPNALYPSQNTNADWIRLIAPDGSVHVTFAEPNLIITQMTLPCKPLNA